MMNQFQIHLILLVCFVFFVVVVFFPVSIIVYSRFRGRIILRFDSGDGTVLIMPPLDGAGWR